MRLRPPAIVLIVWYALLGAGVVAHLHDLAHDREDAAAGQVDAAGHHPVHDDGNCPTHAQLHLAFSFDGAALPPPLVRPSAPPDRSPSAVPRRACPPARLRCRDPPAA